jgi:hypothetical protein
MCNLSKQLGKVLGVTVQMGMNLLQLLILKALVLVVTVQVLRLASMLYLKEDIVNLIKLSLVATQSWRENLKMSRYLMVKLFVLRGKLKSTFIPCLDLKLSKASQVQFYQQIALMVIRVVGSVKAITNRRCVYLLENNAH